MSKTINHEILSSIESWNPNHEYTSDTLPEVVTSGAIRSWELDLPGVEATVGEIAPHTFAAFPSDPRGERIIILTGERSLGRLSLILVQNNRAWPTVLNQNKPTVETLPGQLIIIPETGDDLTHYVCKYYNPECWIPDEVGAGFESVNSYVWNMTHYHPKLKKLNPLSSYYEGFMEIDLRKSKDQDLRLQFKYSRNNLFPDRARILLMGEIGRSSGSTPRQFAVISITGKIEIEGLTVSPERDYHVVSLHSDGKIHYSANEFSSYVLSDAQAKSLAKWLVSHHLEWWNV